MKFPNFVIKHRWSIIVLFTLVTIFFALQIPNIKIDTDVKNYLPQTISSRISTDKIEKIFGGTEILVTVFKSDDVLNEKTLKRIKKISRKLNHSKNFGQLMSLFDTKSIKGEDGSMIVNPAVKKIPRNKEEIEQLRKDLKNNDLAYETVVSKDFKYTAIIAILDNNVKDSVAVNEIKSILAKYPGDEKTYIGGLPLLRILLAKDITSDVLSLMPLSLIIIAAILIISFKSTRGLLLPFSVVIMSILFGMGLMAMLGWKMTMISILLPVMLIAIANNYGIHIVSRYMENSAENDKLDGKEIVARSLDSLVIPILLTGLTTIAGVGGLLFHIIKPAKQLGVVSGIAILFSIIASLTFTPAVLSLLRKPKRNSFGENSTGIVNKSLSFFSNLAYNNSSKVLMGTILVLVISSIGIFKIKVDSDFVNFFPKNHPLRISNKIINDHFGGSQTISIQFQGDIKDPKLLRKMDNYETELESMPGIGNITSISKIIHEISKALNDSGSAMYDKIPDTRNGVAQYIEFYNMSGDPADFEKIVDFNYKNAQMLITVNNTDTDIMDVIRAKLDEYKKKDPNIKEIGGFALINHDFAKLIVKGQIISLVASAIIIIAMVAVMLQSFYAGIIAAVPLTMAIIFLFGSMGFLGIKLDAATAMLSSIMIGLGIDYTIHFIWRYKSELVECENNKEKAIKNTLTNTGKGITFNALSVMLGFAALMISAFIPLRMFGFLILISIGACLVGALLIVPAIVIKFDPKFLKTK